MGNIPKRKIDVDPSYQEGLDLCNEIESLVNELPERAEDFGSGVSEKVDSFRESINKMKKATPKMIEALENMRDGCERWFR